MPEEKKSAAPSKTPKATKAPSKKAANKKKGKRYTPKEKEKLLAKYNAARAEGKNTTDAAKAVGVPYITLRSWEKKSGKKTAGRKKTAAARSTKSQALEKAVRGKKPGRKAKAKTAPRARGGLTLVTPNGFRIEGISSSELIRVLKALK